MILLAYSAVLLTLLGLLSAGELVLACGPPAQFLASRTNLLFIQIHEL